MKLWGIVLLMCLKVKLYRVFFESVFDFVFENFNELGIHVIVAIGDVEIGVFGKRSVRIHNFDSLEMVFFHIYKEVGPFEV